MTSTTPLTGMEAGTASPKAASSVDLLPVFLFVVRQKHILLLSLFGSIVLGLVAAFAWPKTYSATTEVLPPQQRSSMTSNMLSEVNAGAAALASASSELQARSVAESYVHMLGAQPVLDGLIQRFNLQAVYRRRYMVDTRKALVGHSTVAAGKEGFVRITVEDRDAVRAAAMANAYVDQLRELTRHLALTESSQRRMFYEAQLVKSREDLSQAEFAFKRMQQSKGVISLDAQAKTMIEGAAQLRAQIAAKEVELHRLKGFATGNNPQVQGTEDELRALQGELGRAEASSGSGYTGMSLSGIPSAELAFVRASREMRYQESVYELLLKQYEMARMDEARDAPNVQVLQVATVAEKPSWPSKAIVLALAMFLGLLVGLGWTLVRFWMQSLEESNPGQLRDIKVAFAAWRS